MRVKSIAMAAAMGLLTIGVSTAYADKASREAAKAERQEKKAERQDRKAERQDRKGNGDKKDMMSHLTQYQKDHIAFANDGRPYIDPDRGPMPKSMANVSEMMQAKISFSVGIKQGSGISHLQLGRSSDSVSGGSRNGATSDH
jgi:hypothetical protein